MLEVLRFVDDQQRAPASGRERCQKGLQAADQVSLGVARRSDAERHQNSLQQLARLELRADDLRRHHLLRIQAFEQGPHQRGLASADFASHDDEALALVSAELQVRQRVAVPAAVEIKSRVGVELERRAGKPKV